MKKINKLMTSRKGSALAIVLFVFVFVSIISTMVFRVYMNNLHQAKHQEFKVEAYYLAHSGIELAYAALMQLDDVNDPYSCMLYQDYATNQVNNGVTTYEPKLHKKEELDYPFGEGKLDITLESVKDSNDIYWIEISSVSTMEKQLSRKMEISDTLVLKFPFDNPLNKRWSK